MSPDRIGEFEVIERLGRGTTGVVVRDGRIGKNGKGPEYALKIERPADDCSGWRAKAFRDEARFGIHFNHRNLVTAHELFEHDGALVIVMDYVPGVDLDEMIRHLRESGRALPTAVALRVVEGIANGLAYAHELTDMDTGEWFDLVHRDVKPGNVRIGVDGRIKVLDFSVARTSIGPSLTQDGALMGTPRYMGPEQARAERGVGPAADQYAAAAILFELLTLEPLYLQDDGHEVLAAVAEGEVEHRLALAPAETRAVLARALSREPERRFPSARAFADELSRLAHGLAAGPEEGRLLEDLVAAILDTGEDDIELDECPSAAPDPLAEPRPPIPVPTLATSRGAIATLPSPGWAQQPRAQLLSYPLLMLLALCGSCPLLLPTHARVEVPVVTGIPDEISVLDLPSENVPLPPEEGVGLTASVDGGSAPKEVVVPAPPHSAGAARTPNRSTPLPPAPPSPPAIEDRPPGTAAPGERLDITASTRPSADCRGRLYWRASDHPEGAWRSVPCRQGVSGVHSCAVVAPRSGAVMVDYFIEFEGCDAGRWPPGTATQRVVLDGG